MVSEAPSDVFPRRRFTADEVLRMVELGLLDDGPNVELLEGELVA